MEAPFVRLLDGLQAQGGAPAAIVADTFVPWAVRVGNRRRIPVCVLSPLSAAMFSVQYHFHRLPQAAGGSASPPLDGADIADGVGPCLIENYIPGLKSIRLADLEPSHSNKAALNSILEAYVELPCPVFSVGPCIPFMALQEHNANTEKESYMAWLDAQPVNSVLYVSLGSFLSVSPAQLDEIAYGLAQSKVRFMWVLRDACSRVEGLIQGSDGMVVPWSDQLKVLCHPSVGGFLTHCGMNSMLEALYAGVPMLTLPIVLDQPINSRLIVDVWKVGYSLKEKVRADSVIGRDEIAEAVKKLMMNSGDAEGVRRRASLLEEASRTTAEEGGSSYRDIMAFIDFISPSKR
ncbi:hypothetical protein BRADI_2g21317v3 [Brachypodium distachyon]|uniref:Uncharacterized protein n=1 Tax=Brachypodium distachyon TaxID=15368 RepID=A0A2K2D9Q9_BRADI|nr:hypothetical protein BRADI_2g21317v3 [Brachypodium distachyon]